MKASRLWAVFVLVVAVQAIGSYFEGEQKGTIERRPPADLGPETGPVLPPPSPLNPVVVIEGAPPGNSTGSAVAITDSGIWVTARHVVDGCDKVGIVIGNRRAQAVDHIVMHPEADLAILWMRWAPPALPVSGQPLHVNETGFHFGFPEGAPGQAVSKLIGRETSRSRRWSRHRVPVIEWAEVARYPETDRLGGISGGPALDRYGQIVGITIAASKRRGRIITTDPGSLTDLLRAVHVQPEMRRSSRLPDVGLTRNNYVDYGTALRQKLTVAQVICRVYQKN